VLGRSAVAIARCARTALDQGDRRITHLATLVQRDVDHALDAAMHRSDAAASRVEQAATVHLHTARQRVDRAAGSVGGRAPRVLADAERHLDAIAARVTALDPAQVLARGYSITRDESGALVRSARAIEVGRRLITTVADGEIASEVVNGDGS
jgi:exodeoxyribonuclease VII large subunit